MAFEGRLCHVAALAAFHQMAIGGVPIWDHFEYHSIHDGRERHSYDFPRLVPWTWRGRYFFRSANVAEFFLARTPFLTQDPFLALRAHPVEREVLVIHGSYEAFMAEGKLLLVIRHDCPF